MTALAFRYFKEEDVDFAVVEAGLGGRLDATNILSSPKLCVITSVDYDHTHILGKSLAKIAYEKAGIIKKNSSVISAVQSEEVESVLREKCAATHSSLFILGKDFFIKNLRQTKHSSFFDLHTPGKKIRKLEVRLLGLHQVFNASLAVFGSVILSGQGYSLSEREIRKGIKEARLEGRFEIVSKDPFIVVDVAHNVSSLKIVKEAVTFYFPAKEVITIFACSQDKDVKSMVEIIGSFSKHIIFTTFSNPRRAELKKFKEIFSDGYTCENLKDALKLARSLYKRKSLILVVGSTFLVADFKRLFRKLQLC